MENVAAKNSENCDVSEKDFWGGLVAKLQRAHLDPDGLLFAYQTIPVRAINVQDEGALSANSKRFIEAVREQFRKAEPHVRRGFATKVLATGMPFDLPFALNGQPLDVEIPTADQALGFIVSDIAWHDVADENEADDCLYEVQQALLRTGANIRDFGLGDDELVQSYFLKEQNLPPLPELIGMDHLGMPQNVRLYVATIHQRVQAGTASGPIVEGMLRAVIRYLDDLVIETMRPEDIVAFRSRAGLTQAQLGEIIGVSRQHVYALEKGRFRLSARLGHAIMAACSAAPRSSNFG